MESLGSIDAILRHGKHLCPRPALCPPSAHQAQNPKDKSVKEDIFHEIDEMTVILIFFLFETKP